MINLVYPACLLLSYLLNQNLINQMLISKSKNNLSHQLLSRRLPRKVLKFLPKPPITTIRLFWVGNPPMSRIKLGIPPKFLSLHPAVAAKEAAQCSD